MRFTERDQGGAPSVGQHPHQTGPASFRNLAQGSCEGADAEEASEAMYFEELFGEDWPPAAPAPTEMSWLEQPTHEAPASTSVVADLVFRVLARQAAPRTVFEAQVLAEVRLWKSSVKFPEKTPVTSLARWLSIKGYTALASTSTPMPSSAIRRRHSFALVIPAASEYGRAQAPNDLVIVEPFFREQFEIGRPSALYARLLGELPCEFVGTADQLTSLVTALGDQMHTSFLEQGLHTPPWRSVRSMLALWQCSRPPTSEPPRAAAVRRAPSGFTSQERNERQHLSSRNSEQGRQLAAALSAAMPAKVPRVATAAPQQQVRVAWVRSPTAVAVGERIRACGNSAWGGRQ